MAEKLMEVSKVVSWVKKGKGGTYHDKKTGEPRPYQMWSFKIEDDERYFTWFEKSGTPNPVVGSIIKAMEYDYEKTFGSDGKQYDNYKVKWMAYEDAPMNEKPSTKPSNASGSTKTKSEPTDIGPMTMWGKYIGEIISAFIGQGLTSEPLDIACKEAMDTFVDCCIIFEKNYTNVIELPKPKNNMDEVYGEPTFSDGTPLPEEPPF